MKSGVRTRHAVRTATGRGCQRGSPAIQVGRGTAGRWNRKRGGRLSRSESGSGVPASEFIDSAGGIHDLLSAGVERMALRAHVELKRPRQGRTGLEGVSAATGHRDLAILGVNVCFHVVALAMVPRSGAAKSIPYHESDRDSVRIRPFR